VSKRILIVDDSVDLLGAYRDVLEDEGFEVATATSGETALIAIPKARPHLVITDIFMPGMGGLELITRVRSDFAPPAIPIVALSGVAGVRDEAMHRGATAFAVKPLDFEGLLSLVREALEGVAPMPGGQPASAVRDASAARHRQATRALSEAALESYLDLEPDALEDARRLVRVTGRFFGHSRALLMFSRRGTMELAAASDDEPLTEIPAGVLPFAQSALECASSLVASVGEHQAPLSALASAGIRFVACAPVLLGTIPIGVLALVDQTPHPFSGIELSLLELVATRAAHFVGKPSGQHRILERSGLVRTETLIRALAAVMQLHRAPVLGVAVARFPQPFEPWGAAPLVADLPPQTLVGGLGRSSFAAFTATDSVDLAEDRLRQLRLKSSRISTIDAWAQVVLEQAPPVTPEALIAWCERMAERPIDGQEHPLIGIEVKGVPLNEVESSPPP
jgi:DNA-binding response OmpR family regulator